MGNPSSGSKVQTTMPLSNRRHRPSLSMGASLQLEKEKLNSGEKLASGTLSPRTSEEQSIAAFLGDKKMKRRTRSSLGGSEDFTKGLELSAAALAALDERKLMSSISSRGHRRVGSGNVTPKTAESPRAKGTCTPPAVVEKYAVAKIAASLFHSPTKLERSASLSRVAYRVIPDADGSTPRCRTGVGEVILSGKRDALAGLKRQDVQRGLESRNQAVAAHTSENGSGRKSCSLLLEKKMEEGDNVGGELSDALGIEDFSHGSMVFSVDSLPNYEQFYMNAADLPVKDIHPVCFETTNKLCTEQSMTGSLDMGHDLQGIEGSSFSDGVSKQLPSSCRSSNPNGPEAACEEPLHLELQSGNMLSTQINHHDVLSSSNSYPAGVETKGFIDLQGQLSLIITPTGKQILLDQPNQDVKEIMLSPTSQIKDLVDIQGNESKKNAQPISSSDKVSEAVLTEADTLCSLVRRNGDPADPVLISEESKHIVTNASQSGEVEEIILSRENEAPFRNSFSGTDACLRKSTSSEPGLEVHARTEHENKTKLRKRRRSVSASGFGVMLLKVVRVSESGPLETRTLPLPEPEFFSWIDPVKSMGQFQPPTRSLHQDAQVEPETNVNTDAIDMDVEYVDCSSELVVPETDACHNENLEGFFDDTDIKQASEVLELQVVDDTQMIKNCAEGGQLESVLLGSQEGHPDSGCGSTNSDDEHYKREIPLEMVIMICDSHSANKSGSENTADGPNELELAEERFLDARDKSLDRESNQSDTSSFTSGHESVETCQEEEKIYPQELVLAENIRSNELGRIDVEESRRKIRQDSKGTISHDLDLSTEWQPKKADISSENMCSITRERPRSFASMLVSPRQSVDEYRLASSSISILANPSFSSSHQDRLWEEQAEAYSSGGRGTPGREDDPAATANEFDLHSPSPGDAACVSSDDQIQIHSAAGSLRKGQERDLSSGSVASGFVSDTEKRKLGQGKKRGRPRTPLRSLLAEDLHSKVRSGSGHRSPENGHHFLQHLMSRIRGGSCSSSSKSSSPKSSEAGMPKRRNTLWSSCICFNSHVK